MMGIRQILNQHPRTIMVTVTVLLLLLIGLRLYSQRTAQPVPATLSYFSTDDGKTFFADDINLVAPFQREGHEVDAAHVYECNGRRFVGYIERAVSPEASAYIESARREMIATAATQPDWKPDGEIVEKINQRLEIKKPGDPKWVNSLGPGATDVMTVTCPDGVAVPVGP
jgi:hypothetical protein